MALSVQAARDGDRKGLMLFLWITWLLGLGFLGLKGLEYSEHASHGLFPGPGFKQGLPHGTELFFVLYFLLTGLHALHLLAGCGLLTVLFWLAWKSKFAKEYHHPVEAGGLYWHFVDIVWVFLYPLFYLIHG